jgi:tRNA G18 (ribose-2'-O)-methylase SpoU
MKAILVALLGLGISACSAATNDNALTPSPANGQKQAKAKTKAKEKENNTIFEFRGTVQFVTIEGGFYAIYADDGRKFMPRKLSAAHKKHGLVVQVKGKILKDIITYQQHGQVLQIIDIEVLDDSQVDSNQW